MKYLFTLTGLLMTHLIFTQNTKITEDQKSRISEIFTPEYIIESSKPISIIIEQDSVIKVRNLQLKEKEEKIKKLEKEYKILTEELKINTKNLKRTIVKEDKVVEDLINNKPFKNNLHLYGTLRGNLNGNTDTELEILYEFKKLQLGISSEVFVYEYNYKFNSYIKLRYKIF